MSASASGTRCGGVVAIVPRLSASRLMPLNLRRRGQSGTRHPLGKLNSTDENSGIAVIIVKLFMNIHGFHGSFVAVKSQVSGFGVGPARNLAASV
jgi:hypothetical protein